ncbi:MAG TPA: hypothetical protein VHZ02_09750 [Acidimicrobiales bacterium]|jgi:hypothetical protein|nr:hypothetical protein [Acidimicrobiales bacterium]
MTEVPGSWDEGRHAIKELMGSIAAELVQDATKQELLDETLRQVLTDNAVMRGTQRSLPDVAAAAGRCNQHAAELLDARAAVSIAAARLHEAILDLIEATETGSVEEALNRSAETGFPIVTS